MNSPQKVWAQYQKGVQYNQNLNLYDVVKENEDYYNDKQWGDLNAPDLDKPVLNFIKPVVNYYVALLISDDIATNITLGAGSNPEERDIVPKVISKEVEEVMEMTNMKYQFRKVIRNTAIDGDSAGHLYFDVDEDEIKFEILDNTNVYFGDTSSADVQTQPYIILAYRRLVKEVRKRAEELGKEPDLITADSDDYLYPNAQVNVETQYTTVLRKYWKDKGTVWVWEGTRNCELIEETNLELKLYPVSWMCWEDMKNSYHGVSPVTGKIANQQYVNKMYAMAMQYCKLYAFPKAVYDKTKLPNGWNNQIGKAIGVNGNPRESVLMDSVGASGFNSQAIELANQTVSQTKDLMGASDAALGNVKPDNTSAIIATQKAANAPLDIQRLVFYNFVEDVVREMIDIMRVYYGERPYLITDNFGAEMDGTYNYSDLNNYKAKLSIDIGQGSYWSELMQIQTLDALMTQGIIPDAQTYLECLPEGYVKNKQGIIDKWQEMKDQQMGMEEMPQGMEMPSPEEAAAEEIGSSDLAEDIPDDDLASLCAELQQIPEDKRGEIIAQLNVSDETKQKIVQLMEAQNAMPEM